MTRISLFAPFLVIASPAVALNVSFRSQTFGERQQGEAIQSQAERGLVFATLDCFVAKTLLAMTVFVLAMAMFVGMKVFVASLLFRR